MTNTNEMKPFPLSVVLSITTGLLLMKPRSKDDNNIGEIYKILGWMTDDSPFTHQLPRFGEECKPWLLRWFPELARVDEHTDSLKREIAHCKGNQEKAMDAVEAWLNRVKKSCRLKSVYDVPRIPRDDHERIHPYDELVSMRGTDEGIIVIEPEEPV